MPVSIIGLSEFMSRLQPKALIEEPLAKLVEEAGKVALTTVQEGTPIVSSALYSSEQLEAWPTFAKVSVGQDIPYASFIETGQRRDPRVRGGIVYRRAGAARMFRKGSQAARDYIKSHMPEMIALIRSRWAG